MRANPKAHTAIRAELNERIIETLATIERTLRLGDADRHVLMGGGALHSQGAIRNRYGKPGGRVPAVVCPDRRTAEAVRNGVIEHDGRQFQQPCCIALHDYLERLGLADVGSRVAFLQGDACNLKPLFTDYDLVFAGNLIDRLYDPALFLTAITSRIRAGGCLAITSPYTWLEEYTAKAKWLGGRREHGEPLSTFAGLSRALEPSFMLVAREDVPFVIRETARKHQHSIAELTIWQRT
jgi:hypothetical protein